MKKLILIPNTLQLKLLFISEHGEITYHGKHVSHSTTDLSCFDVVFCGAVREDPMYFGGSERHNFDFQIA